MPPDQLLALVLLAASGAFTPGPNNALVASSGATHGFRSSVPHILGIGFGFPLMIFLVGLFLGGLFQQSVLLRQGLKVIGIVVLAWMAWRTATAGMAKGAAPRRPLTFLQAAAFQWINPKGWTFAVAVTSQFVDTTDTIRTAFECAAIFGLMGLASSMTWAAAGRGMNRWLTTAGRLHAFNVTMAGLIVVSVVLLFLD